MLFAANGYRAQIQGDVDPKAEPIKITLKTLNDEKNPKRKLIGRVVDQNGEVVAGARVRVSGAKQGDRKWWGQVRETDGVAITGNDGKFTLTTRVDFDQLCVEVNAAGFYSHNSPHFDMGGFYQIQLDPGSIVTGVIKNKGRPVAGHVLGICQLDRGRDFIGAQVIATDENGRFEFTSVYPEDRYTLYSIMSENTGNRMLETVQFKTKKTGEVRDVGEFELSEAFTIGGRVILSDGKSLPKNLRLFAGRDYAWDSQRMILKEDGGFELKHLPREPISLSVRLAGYRISTKNRFQLSGESGVVLFVDRDHDDLELIFEPEENVGR